MIALFGFLLFLFLGHLKGVYLFYQPQWMKDDKCCSDAERIAKTIGGALAEYFAIPEHNRLPSLEELEQWAGYALNDAKGRFMATLDETGDDILITVSPNPDFCRCPAGKVYTHRLP